MTDTRPPDVITVAGHDLVEELIGQRTFTDMIHLVLTRTPTPPPGHREMIDALLVTLADHGVTPSSLAARLTLLGAPEAMQAAVAAGLCGAGSRFLGTLENAGVILTDALERHPDRPLPEIADAVVADAKAARQPVIGIGHPEHKRGDPRVPKLVALAERHGVRGRAIDLLLECPDALVRAGGPLLPVNGGGLCGAIVADMGYGPTFGRGIAVIARAAGLVGQLLDEERAPVARLLWDRERENPVT
ncbi:MAG: citryl-CoA lyase [Actinomycetota bacterium]|nr:citryl-CoA lyase [Actinomycetota bacterium]